MTGSGSAGSPKAKGEDTFQSKGPFPIAQAVLTIHGLYELPRAMQHFNAMCEYFAVVFRPVVKYYRRGYRIISIPLGEHELSFEPSKILCKGSHSVVDLDALAANGLSLQRDACCHRSVIGTSSPVCANPSLFDEEHDETTKLGGGVSSNQLHLRYPRPEGITTLIDVVIGVKEYRKGSCTSRWTFGNFDSRKFSEGVGYFSVETKNVESSKVVTRVVGLSVGFAICSVSVSPHDEKEDIARRLVVDQKSLVAQCTGDLAKEIEATDVAALLCDGVSEINIYRSLLLLADPDYYVRRLDALIAMYPSGGGSEWRRVNASVLLAEYVEREEELLRRAVVEFGPECCNVSTRHRLLAFRKKYSLNDHEMQVFFSRIGVKPAEVFDADVGFLFAALTEAFGKEPRPTSYLFPGQSYSPHRNALFYEKLQFSERRTADNYRDAGLASRNKRVPFTMSPYERPLYIGNEPSPLKKMPCEIDVLREKYAPEFAQVVPSIASAILAIVQQNANIQHSTKLPVFSIFNQPEERPHVSFQDFVHRIAEYALISPSSLLGAAIYLDRLCVRQPKLLLTGQNIFRLFLTSVRVSSKIIELRSINNRQYAGMFGVDMKGMNKMEEVFIKQLDFDLFVTPQEFREYARLLQPRSVSPFPLRASSRCSQAEAKPAGEAAAREGGGVEPADGARPPHAESPESPRRARKHVGAPLGTGVSPAIGGE